MRRTTKLLAATAAVVLVAAQVWAQSIEVPEVESPSEQSNFFVRAGYGHRFDANIQDLNRPGDDTFATDDVRAEVGGTVAFNEDVSWLNFLGYGFNNYDSDLVDAHVNNLTLASIVGWKMDDHWRILFGPMISAYAESGADWGDAISIGGAFGTTYSPSPELTVGVALITLRRFEEGFSLLPVLMTNWRFAPDWRLVTGMTEVAARRGIGGYISWAVAEPVEISLGMQFESRRFRMDEGVPGNAGRIPGECDSDECIAYDRSVPVYARVSVRIVEGLTADVLGGAAFGGQLRVKNSHDDFPGDTPDKPYGAAALLGVRVIYAMDL